MEHFHLKKASTSYSVPRLGLGTWQLRGEACRRAIFEALKIGYRHIDTAQIYDNESEVGDGLAEGHVKREEVFLVTKVWRDNLGYDDVLSSTKESLRKLKTDYVDLLLIHWPNASFFLKETLLAMKELIKEKKTRFIGLSNFPIQLMEEARGFAPELVCNQVEYHPFLSQDKVLSYLRKHRMFLTAYCPLARAKVFKNSVFEHLAKKYQKTPSQIALRWLLDQDSVVSIPKASSYEHILQNFEIFDFKISDEHKEQIDLEDKTQRLIDPEWSPQWDQS